MQTVITIHHPDNDHLDAVIADMRAMGAPAIRVVHCGDHYFAIEGVHRLHAAKTLGIDPDFIVLDQDDMVGTDTLDIDLYDADDGIIIEAWRIVEQSHNPSSAALTFGM